MKTFKQIKHRLTSIGISTLERDFQREIPNCQISRVIAALAYLCQTLLDTLMEFCTSRSTVKIPFGITSMSMWRRVKWLNKITHRDHAPFRAKVKSIFAVGVVDVVKFRVLDGSCDWEKKFTLDRHDEDYATGIDLFNRLYYIYSIYFYHFESLERFPG